MSDHHTTSATTGGEPSAPAGRAGLGPAEILSAGQAPATTPEAAAGGPTISVFKRYRTLAHAVTGSGVLHPGFPMDSVGVRWTSGTPRIRIVETDGGRGPWQVIDCGCPAGPDDEGSAPTEGTAHQSRLVAVGGAAAIEIALPESASAVAINTTTPLPASAASRSATAQLAGRDYLDRAAWGADESLRFTASGTEIWPPTYWPVQTFTVHHTATANDDPDPAARVRAIYHYQAVDEGWGDLGYHFFIDEAGRIYEGRWSGDDGLPGFSPDGKTVDGAHVAGFNAGNVGIALLGDLTDRLPTDDAYSTLVALLAHLTRWQRIDPLAAVHYVNPISGATADVMALAGHRDWAATQCPGNAFYPKLPQLRQDVASL